MSATEPGHLDGDQGTAELTAGDRLVERTLRLANLMRERSVVVGVDELPVVVAEPGVTFGCRPVQQRVAQSR